MLIANYIIEKELRKIHDESFPFQDLANKLYISQKTVIDNGEIVAAGLVRLTAEGILMCNMNMPVITRARATRELIESLKKDVQSRGLDECHVFVKDPKVQEFLMKLGFKICRGGQPLVIHF